MLTLIGVPNNALFSLSTLKPAHSVVDCGDPGTPTNGQRSLSSTTYTSEVTYTCDVGYTLQGPNSRTCQSNGQWSGSVPQCNGMSVKHQLWDFSCNTICYNMLGSAGCRNPTRVMCICYFYTKFLTVYFATASNYNDPQRFSSYTLIDSLM